MASPFSYALISIVICLIAGVSACPGGAENERVEPIKQCEPGEPKCPKNSYCYPLVWQGVWQFQWVCCPNMTAVISPSSPPLFPVVPSPTTNLIIPGMKKSKGIPISIQLNEASRSQLPFAVMSLVQEQIQRYPVLLFSLSGCPWCTRAKELLDDYYPTLTYYYFDYDLSPDGYPIANAAMGVSGMQTVPMIYVCKELIGGFIDLQNLHVAHELEKRMRKCTAL